MAAEDPIYDAITAGPDAVDPIQHPPYGDHSGPHVTAEVRTIQVDGVNVSDIWLKNGHLVLDRDAATRLANELLAAAEPTS